MAAREYMKEKKTLGFIHLAFDETDDLALPACMICIWECFT